MKNYVINMLSTPQSVRSALEFIGADTSTQEDKDFTSLIEEERLKLSAQRESHLKEVLKARKTA